MSGNIKILILEDEQSDAELLLYELKKSELVFTSEIAQNRGAFESALDKFRPDIILSDYSLPSFDGVSAFHIKQKKYPDIPFIIVSGTIGEEKAVELIKIGITNYALKDKLFTISVKILQALKESEERNAKKNADEKFKKEHEKLVRAERQIRKFAKHLNQVLEEERAHIAREIHDDAGQQLVGIKIALSMLTTQESIDTASKERINTLMENVDATLQSLRKISTALRPGILDSLGLASSIEWLTEEFEKRTNIKCHIQLDEVEHRFEKNISICFFRVCQEALTNISKHANASEVIISLNKTQSELTLKISDNGIGFVGEKLENPFSMGLLGMRERANLLGGDLSITSQKNFGTTIHLKVDLNENKM